MHNSIEFLSGGLGLAGTNLGMFRTRTTTALTNQLHTFLNEHLNIELQQLLLALTHQPVPSAAGAAAPPLTQLGRLKQKASALIRESTTGSLNFLRAELTKLMGGAASNTTASSAAAGAAAAVGSGLYPPNAAGANLYYQQPTQSQPLPPQQQQPSVIGTAIAPPNPMAAVNAPSALASGGGFSLFQHSLPAPPAPTAAPAVGALATPGLGLSAPARTLNERVCCIQWKFVATGVLCAVCCVL